MKTKHRYTYNVIGFSILIFLLVRNYLPFFLNSFNKSNSTILILLFSSISLAIACLLPVISIEKLLNFTPTLFKNKFNTKHLPFIFYSQILFLIITFLSQIFIYIFQSFTLAEPLSQELLAIDNIFVFLAYYISIALFPSVFEEIFVRGYLLTLLSKYGKFSAIILSSLIFSLMHQTPEQVFAAFLSSLVLGWLYLKTKNIFVCIGAHLLNNSYSFFMLYISQYVHGVSNISLLTFINFCVLILGFSSYVYLKKLNSSFNLKQFINKEKDILNFKSFFLSPVLMVSLLWCVNTIYFIFKERL